MARIYLGSEGGIILSGVSETVPDVVASEPKECL